MATDRSEWERILTCFQAFARGYLVRNEVLRARQDFEDLVREIDGGLTHLQWREAVIPVPQFSDTRAAFLQSRPPHPGRDVCDRLHKPPLPEREDPSARLEKLVAEKDDSEDKQYFPISHVEMDGGEDAAVVTDGGVMESTGDSTTIWSSVELDMQDIHSHRGSRQYCLARDVPRTPEALRLHRNTLTMELLWLQQAIDSRKKYLSLKDRLNVS